MAREQFASTGTGESPAAQHRRVGKEVFREGGEQPPVVLSARMTVIIVIVRLLRHLISGAQGEPYHANCVLSLTHVYPRQTQLLADPC